MYSVLQPTIGFHYFNEGVSNLKQVTGRTQQDIQRTLVAAITGSAPPGMVIVIHSLLDFCYLVEAPELNDNDCDALLSLLQTLHDYKLCIIKAGS